MSTTNNESRTYIYKYPLEVKEINEIEFPGPAEILSLHVQHNVPTMWVAVDTGGPSALRRFRIFGTGELMDDPDKYLYVGTVLTEDGDFVWHVFEEI